ncbi:MAG: WG repeat-containing protein [Bacteroidales bacterium]|nr:WG repeat-containing protein [Bacteroidales bacterium]MBP5518133.1 WG repeat-containing protein [Bacteroidales bacterium]
MRPIQPINFNEEHHYGSITLLRRGWDEYSVIDSSGNTIVPFGKYQYIDGFEQGLARVKKGDAWEIIAWVPLDGETSQQRNVKNEEEKWGIINENGEEVLPVVYDDIWKFYNKGRNSTKVVKDGVSSLVYFKDLNPAFVEHASYHPRQTYRDYEVNDTEPDYYDDPFEERINYDYMGLDADDIDDAFEGDPSAYWNID